MEIKEKLLAEVMYLSVVAQERTGRCIFFRYSGHVDCIEIQIRESKEFWRWDLAETQISLKRESGVQRLEEIKELLQKFISEEKITLEDFDPYVEEITRYTF